MLRCCLGALSGGLRIVDREAAGGLGGLPEGVPERPAEAAPSARLQPMTPREVKKLNEGEQKNLERN